MLSVAEGGDEEEEEEREETGGGRMVSEVRARPHRAEREDWEAERVVWASGVRAWTKAVLPK